MTAQERPLAGLRFALVGPGRVGASLAAWAVARGATCVVVAGRPGSARAAELASRLEARAGTVPEVAAEPVDLLLVAVPDAEIADVARRLAGTLRAVVLHVSGALGAGVLAPLAAAGCATGSFHPLRAFPDVTPDPDRARGTFFALDGSAPAVALGHRLASAFGGDAAEVPESVRPVYHLAASLAAGGVATLLASATALARAGGVPDAARRGYAALARGAIEAAAAADDAADAITGPAVRGDLETLTRHLAALESTLPRLRPLVLEVARAALARRAERGPLSPAQQALADRLQGPDLLDRPRDPMLTWGPSE